MIARLRMRGATTSAVLAVAVALLSLFPFLHLFSTGFSWAVISDLFRYPQTASAIIRSIWLTLSISALSIIIGVGAAWLVVRSDIPFRRVLTVLLALPLSIPGFVSAYAAYSGNLLLAPQQSIVSTFWGATAVLTLTLYPYVFLACVIAVRNLDPAQEEVARSLGRSSWAVFRSVTFQQLRPAMAPAILIVALHVLSEFGAMAQLNQTTLTTSIVSEMLNYGHYDNARSLSVLLVVLSAIFLMLGAWFSGRPTPLSVSSQTVRPGNRHRLGVWKVPALIAVSIVVLAAIAPTLAMTVRGMILAAARSTTDWPLVLSSTGNSLGYGVAAGLVATVAALPIAWLLSRHPSLFSRLTERSVWLAHSIPSAVLALSLVFIGTQLVPVFYKTNVLLIASYVILFLPLAVTNQTVGFQASFVKFDEVGKSLGAGTLMRLMRISLPLALPGIATGALLVGLDAAKELTSTLMLIPFNTDTLSTGLWATTNGESLDFAAAAPYSLMLLILGAVPVWLIVRRTLQALAD